MTGNQMAQPYPQLRSQAITTETLGGFLAPSGRGPAENPAYRGRRYDPPRSPASPTPPASKSVVAPGFSFYEEPSRARHPSSGLPPRTRYSDNGAAALTSALRVGRAGLALFDVLYPWLSNEDRRRELMRSIARGAWPSHLAYPWHTGRGGFQRVAMCSSPSGPPDRLWNTAAAAPPGQSQTWANVCHISALVSQGWTLQSNHLSFSRIVSLPLPPLYPNRGQHYDVWARSAAGPAIQPAHAPLVPGRVVHGPFHDVIPWLQPHTQPFVLEAGRQPEALPLADVGRYNRWSGRAGTPSARGGGNGPAPWRPPTWNPWHNVVQMRNSRGPVELVVGDKGSPYLRGEDHRFAPPPPKAREKKAKAFAPRAIRMIQNITSETSDAVKAIHDALPKKYQRSRAWYDGKEVKQRRTTTMLQDLYNHWDKIDWEEAIWNLAENEVKDQAIGRLSKQADKLTEKIFTRKGKTQGVSTRLDKAIEMAGMSPMGVVSEAIGGAFKYAKGSLK